MSRSRGRRARYVQESIADLELGTEHIAGAVPIDPTEAAAARDDFYTQFVAKVEELGPVICMPDYGLHVYHVGRRFCVCKERSRTLAEVEKHVKELP